MTPDLEQVRFYRVFPPEGQPGQPAAPGLKQIWDFYSAEGWAFARANVYPGNEEWRVDIIDRAPMIESGDLVRLVGRLLLWHVGTRIETVRVILGRKVSEPQTLVLVGGEYV